MESQPSFFKKLRYFLGFRFVARAPRANYKRFWNFVAHDQDDAKRLVSGYTDEAEYDRTGKYTVGMLEQTVGIRPDDVVLEIGAGVGRVGKMLAPRVKEWIGADVSANMLKHIRQRLAGMSNVRTVELNGYDLAPIASASVDVVYCTVVFMHLDEWDRYNYVLEGMRVLKPGGRMMVDNFNLASDAGWKFFMEQKNQYAPLQRPPHISKSSTPAELHAYFKRAGFENIQQAEVDLWIQTWGVKPQ